MVEARLVVLPLLLLWAGPAAILLAHLSLGQFKLFYSALDQVASRNDGFWRFTQPVLQQPMQQLRSCFGPPSEFAATPSQVMIVALLLATSEHCSPGVPRLS
ncbi:hypothetical protein WJX74_003063 [Apatococcus lobatus]|uniref:Secreted protein n=1 Tax=Apatococcus lobatus TaxID=904363 RepID=A0AAW1QYC8_9CHLO